jgi:signal transduction histidine kinase
MKALGEQSKEMAHDFNNLLASILGNTQLLMTTVNDAAAQQRLRSIEGAVKSAAGILKKMQSMTESAGVIIRPVGLTGGV